MKTEEDQIYREQNIDSIINGHWSIIEKAATLKNINQNAPKARYHHTSFVFKNKLYIHGGAAIPSTQLLNDPQDIFVYNFEESKWQKIKTKANQKDFQLVSSHCGALLGNKWYSFGGTNSAMKCNNLLWRLNVQTFEWVKMQQKGSVPPPRQAARLLAFEKSWLILYGGINLNDVEIYNSFSFYNIETRIWIKYDGSYDNLIYARLDFAMCIQENKIYLFGGAYRNINNQEKYLNDFYQIEPIISTRSITPKIKVKRIINNVTPQQRSGHTLTPLNENYIILIGGQNSIQSTTDNPIRQEEVSILENMWIYSINHNKWAKIKTKNSNYIFTTCFTTNYYNDTLYLFGGIKNYSQVIGDLTGITLNLNQLKDISANIKIKKCLNCISNQQFDWQSDSKFTFSSDFIDDISNQVSFPFAAIGLLIDNSLNQGANNFKISYHFDDTKRDNNNHTYFKFEDNAKLNCTDEEFYSSMTGFQANLPTVTLGIDKKIRMNLIKENQIRQYGSNLKIGALRLGSSFVFVSQKSAEEIRVCLFIKQSPSSQSYSLYHLNYSLQNFQLIDPRHESLHFRIGDNYHKLIRECGHSKYRNTLFIFNPVVQNYNTYYKSSQCQLFYHHTRNDIIYGNPLLVQKLDLCGYNIFQCVDVSLRSYISMLYLKNDQMKILFSIRKDEQPIQIYPQMYLDKIDKLCKNKIVLELDGLIDFEFKIAEIYYLPDIKKKINFFSNGLLIYHKNRLITRYKYQLGDLPTHKTYKIEGQTNFLRLFGCIELPDSIPVNVFKTDFVFNIMLEKLYSRIKFINKFLKTKINQLTEERDFKRVTPSKLSQEEFKMQEIQFEQQKKRQMKIQRGEISQQGASKEHRTLIKEEQTFYRKKMNKNYQIIDIEKEEEKSYSGSKQKIDHESESESSSSSSSDYEKIDQEPQENLSSKNKDKQQSQQKQSNNQDEKKSDRVKQNSRNQLSKNDQIEAVEQEQQNQSESKNNQQINQVDQNEIIHDDQIIVQQQNKNKNKQNINFQQQMADENENGNISLSKRQRDCISPSNQQRIDQQKMIE